MSMGLPPPPPPPTNLPSKSQHGSKHKMPPGRAQKNQQRRERPLWSQVRFVAPIRHI